MRNKAFLAATFSIVFVFIIIRVIGVGPDISNSDAGRWHRRSLNFLNALKQKDYKSTYQRYHPGVTMMWVNAIVEQISLKQQLRTTREPQTLENADYYPIIHGYSKIANITVLSILLILQVYLISRLFNKETALIYAFLLAVEPYLIGINRWFHLSSFEVFFGVTSLLSLLMWHKTNLKKYLVLSALLLSFSILSKVTSLILGLVLIFVFIDKYLKDKRLENIFLYGFFVIIFIFCFFPALWVDPGFVLHKILEPVTLAVTSNIRSQMIPAYMQPFYYIYILAFKLSPVTFVLFFVSLWSLKKTRSNYVKYLLLTSFVYYLFLTLTEQKIDRYALALIPYVLLIISFYLQKKSKAFKGMIAGLSLVLLMWFMYAYHPVYSAYYSPLFGGTKSALNIGIYDNSGEYFSQAAFYLNEKGRDMYTYVPNGIESFSYYYKGKLQRSYDSNTNYILKSLDMNRLYLQDDNCPNLIQTFGSRDYKVVGVFKCQPQ